MIKKEDISKQGHSLFKYHTFENRADNLRGIE